MSADRDVLELMAEARPARLDRRPGTRPDPAEFMAGPQPDAGARRSTARPARRLVLAGLVPAVAVVAVGAVVLSNQSGSPAPGGTARASDPAIAATPKPTATAGAAPKSARDLFLVAAERSASDAATSGRYWVRTVEDSGAPVRVGPASRPYQVAERLSMTGWDATRAGDQSLWVSQDLGAAPVTAEDRAAWVADGSPTQWKRGSQVIAGRPGEKTVSVANVRALDEAKEHGGTFYPYMLAGHGMTVATLAKVPTDPAALKRWLSGRLKTNEIFVANDHTLFEAGVDLVFSLPVPPKVRAAAYGMLADVKGVTSLGAVTDQRGRTGVAVGFARKNDGGRWIQTRLIVDPGTGQALARESWDLGAGKSPAAHGTLTTRSLLIRADFTDDTPPAVTHAR